MTEITEEVFPLEINYISAYAYNPNTFEFSGFGKYRESPDEPGVFWTPINSTNIAPPDFPIGHVAVFDINSEAWTILVKEECSYDEPDSEPKARRLTSLAFIEQFTDYEQLAIVTATMANPVIKLWYDKLLAADDILFDDPRLLTGMDALVSYELITAERHDEILGLGE